MFRSYSYKKKASPDPTDYENLYTPISKHLLNDHNIRLEDFYTKQRLHPFINKQQHLYFLNITYTHPWQQRANHALIHQSQTTTWISNNIFKKDTENVTHHFPKTQCAHETTAASIAIKLNQYPTVNEEIDACIYHIIEKYKQNPTTSIGIIIPNTLSYQHYIEQALTEQNLHATYSFQNTPQNIMVKETLQQALMYLKESTPNSKYLHGNPLLSSWNNEDDISHIHDSIRTQQTTQGWFSNFQTHIHKTIPNNSPFVTSIHHHLEEIRYQIQK